MAGNEMAGQSGGGGGSSSGVIDADEGERWLQGPDDDGNSDGGNNDNNDNTDNGSSVAPMEADDRQALRAKAAAESEEWEFPDEVLTPEDVPARKRFARYRALKSFRSSPWDAKESLPRDYARVFQVCHQSVIIIVCYLQ